MPTQRELEEMQNDFEQMDLEGQLAKEELRLLKEGHTMLIPYDIEHARSMFKMACFYLSQNDKDFKLQMEK